MFRTASQNRIFQDVVNQIQEAILEGKLKTGDILPSERELKETFSISRGTLREALRVLEQKGLIEIKLGIGGGSVVKALNTEQISESLALLIRTQNVSLNHLAEFREGIEGVITAQAAERAKKTDIQVLKELLQEARACIEMGSSHRDTFIDIDKQIHLTLAKITGNPIYQSLMYSVHENIHRYYDQYLSMEERELNENYQDLCDIVNAVEQGHADEACLLAQNHVHRFNRYMKNRARQKQKGTS